MGNNNLNKMKKCSKCGEEKELNKFVKSSRNKSGWGSICLGCKRKQYEDNKNKILKQQKEYYNHNKEVFQERNKNYYENNKEKVQKIQKEYLDQHKEEIKEYQRQYKKDNRKELTEKEKERYKNNIDRRKKKLEYTKKYYRENIDFYNKWHSEYRKKEETKEYKREWIKEKYRSDINFKLHMIMSSEINLRIRGKKYKKDFMKYLPYTIDDLKQYLEKQFDGNMTWENHGKYWHIDHILPRSLFIYNTLDCDEFKKCWALENLRPLEAKENLRKGNRIIKIKKENNINELP